MKTTSLRLALLTVGILLVSGCTHNRQSTVTAVAVVGLSDSMEFAANAGSRAPLDACEFGRNIELVGEQSPQVGTVETYTLENADGNEVKRWTVKGAQEVDGQVAKNQQQYKVTKTGNSIDVLWEAPTGNGPADSKIIVRKEVPCQAQAAMPEIVFPVHPSHQPPPVVPFPSQIFLTSKQCRGGQGTIDFERKRIPFLCFCPDDNNQYDIDILGGNATFWDNTASHVAGGGVCSQCEYPFLNSVLSGVIINYDATDYVVPMRVRYYDGILNAYSPWVYWQIRTSGPEAAPVIELQNDCWSKNQLTTFMIADVQNNRPRLKWKGIYTWTVYADNGSGSGYSIIKGPIKDDSKFTVDFSQHGYPDLIKVQAEAVYTLLGSYPTSCYTDNFNEVEFIGVPWTDLSCAGPPQG